MTIDSQPYVKQISTPTILQVMAMSAEQFNTVMGIQLTRGAVVEEDGSQFIGYSISTNRYEDVQQAYIKMKVLHALATDIVCISNTRSKELQCEDHCDDKDSGCRWALLKWMIDSAINCKAIFIARTYGGEKLGSK